MVERTKGAPIRARALSPRRRTAVACLVGTLAVVAFAAAPAHALDVGISDQAPEALGDPRLASLPIARARLVVPWDAAFTIGPSVDAWLGAAAARGLVPLIAFERGRGQTCPSACAIPSLPEYADAVRAFRARWPQVRELTPWNEPNHPAQPTARDPAAAAAFHDVLRTLCPQCTVVAGDLVDSTNMKSYFRSYSAALRTPATVWGIHNYGDVIYGRASYLAWLADQVATPVWMTETGGIVRLGSGATETLPDDPLRAADGIDRVFALAAAHPGRVARAYLYQWRARPGDDFDAGLVAPDGTARPGLGRLRAQLGLPADPGPASALDGPPVDVPGMLEGAAADREALATATGAVRTTSTPSALTVTYGNAPPLGVGRPQRVAGGVRLRVTCPAQRRAGCRGTVSALLQVLYASAPERLGRADVRVPAGRHRDLRIAVSRTARRRWNRALAWELRTVSVIRAPTAVQDRTWRTPRR